jgi:nucleoside-diphosphate-sugar epimerase
MIKIGIIGAGGTAGKFISRYLAAQNKFELIRFTRKRDKKDVSGFFVFDFKSENWSDLGRFDVIINCAGIIRESRYDDFYRVHVELVKTLLANRVRLGDPRIIHISALGADKNHSIDFLRTKGIGDDLLLANPDTYVLRPSIICLPENILVQKFKWLVFMTRLLANRPIVPTGFLETVIQPVMGEDLAESVYRLCENHYTEREIPIVGKDPLSFRKLLEITVGIEKKKIFPIEIPKKMVEPVTKNFISVWFPELINTDQFNLLFKDNVAEPDVMEKLIGRESSSTLQFWKEEFRRITLNDLI